MSIITTSIAITVFAPLLAAIAIVFFRSFIKLRTHEIALAAAIVSLLSSFFLLGSDSSNGLNELIFSGLPNMPLKLVATPITALLSITVAVISTFVLVYATGYMAKDNEKHRFFATLLLFISAMQILVLAGDWILLLSAWEIIGLSSYLLIGFWYQKTGVKSAASRAFLVTRSADVGLYIAVFILIANAGTSDIAATLSIDDKNSHTTAIIAGLFLLIAAMGKSAQTPFHDWLQRAMAGPTPVSALLHSATLVAAGAILLIKTSPLFPQEVLIVIGMVGGITAIVTGLIALTESDLKRVLAASTSSQYGLMLLAIGAGVPLAALLHLIAHAAIKSSLFLGAGVFQHSRNSTKFEDLKGIAHDHPRIFFGFAIAALALAGIPPLSGFFSKDAIIAATMASTYAWLFAPLVLIGTILTGAYMARALKLLWRDKDSTKDQIHVSDSLHSSSHKHTDAKTPINNDHDNHQASTNDAIKWMAIGFSALVFMAVILGSSFSSIENFLADSFPHNTSENPTNNMMAAMMGSIAAITGLTLGWFVSRKSLFGAFLSELLGPLLSRAKTGFSIAGGWDNLCVRPALNIAQNCEKLERYLYRFILSIGQFSVKLAHVARRYDEEKIDRFIFSGVKYTISLGGRARRLQSGLIHKEMAITTVITAGLIVITLIGLMLL